MQVQAIYKDGKVELLEPLHLRRNNVRVIVTVPADEVESDNPYNLSPEILERARATATRMAAIRNAPPPPDDKLPELTEKQRQRIAAFALRDEIKGLR